MERCGFFDANLVGEEYDRVYLASQFAAYFASFIGNGVFAKHSNQLQVVEMAMPQMQIGVERGQAWINGYWYENTDMLYLPIDVADGVLNRIDSVVLRLGFSERNMWLAVKKGTPAINPIAPEVTRTADYYELQLATISIPAGSIKITQAQITDTRMNQDVCGWVTGAIDQIDTTGLFAQYQTAFNDWFQKLKDVLDEDTAGNLLNMVNDLAGGGRTTETVKGNADAIAALAGEGNTTTIKALKEALDEHKSETASTTAKGHVQLYNGTDSTSTTLAATSSAVKAVNDALTAHKSDNVKHISNRVISATSGIKDCNNAIEVGFYNVFNDALNKPVESGFFGLIVTYAPHIRWVQQIAIQYDTGQVYVRRSSDDGNNTRVWNAWVRLLNQDDYDALPILTGDAPFDIDTIYVSPSGNDNNSGMQDAPLKTINMAINKLRMLSCGGSNVGGRQQIRLLDGTYNEELGVGFNKRCFNGGELRIVADNERRAIINNRENYFYNSTGVITIDGIVFNGSLFIKNCHNTVVSNCTLNHTDYNNGLEINGSNVTINGTIINNYVRAINVGEGSIVSGLNISGSGNSTGIDCDKSIVFKGSGYALSATTATVVSNGGLIY